MGAPTSEMSQQQQAALSLAPPSPFTATAPLTSTASAHVSQDTLKLKDFLIVAVCFKCTHSHTAPSTSAGSASSSSEYLWERKETHHH